MELLIIKLDYLKVFNCLQIGKFTYLLSHMILYTGTIMNDTIDFIHGSRDNVEHNWPCIRLQRRIAVFRYFLYILVKVWKSAET